MRSIRLLGAAAAILAVVAPRWSAAQPAPNADWRTITTPRFRVHFTPPLEEAARRAAVIAERAFDALATELVPPRTPVHLVIADNVDFTNGYATMLPSNRIVVFMHPPVELHTLRNYDDWSTLVIVHELTHIFHLDRTRGWWRAAQRVFGRAPVLFPNAYLPTWVIEGLAVYYESRLTGAGRLEGTGHEMIARAAAAAHAVPRLNDITASSSRFPGGDAPYAYGALLFEHLARTRGAAAVRDFVERTSGVLLPIGLNSTARRSFGTTFESAFRQWSDSLARTMPAGRDPLPGWRELTAEGRYAHFPRWLGDTAIIFSANTGRETSGSYSVSLDGRVRRLSRRNSLDVTAPAGGRSVFAQQEYIDYYTVRSDLFVERNGAQTRLTRGARLAHPDVRGDGEIVAVQATPGSTSLVRVSADGAAIRPIVAGTLDLQWAEPRWSPDGSKIAAVRMARGGLSDIVVMDTLGRIERSIARARSVQSAPSWSSDGGSIYFSSDRSGTPQLYVAHLASSAGDVAFFRLSDAVAGVFEPEPSPGGRWLSANQFLADGHHIGIAPAGGERATPQDTVSMRRGECAACVSSAALRSSGAVVSDSSRARKYSAWSSLLPTYWLPEIGEADDGATALGAFTSGEDVLGRHWYGLTGLVNTRNGELDLQALYSYAGLGVPFVDLELDQDWGHSSIYNQQSLRVGDLASRSRTFAVRLVFPRRRARTFAHVSAGFALESIEYSTTPDTLRARLSPRLQRDPRHPKLTTTVGWSNAQRPSLAISYEDGVAISGFGEHRWERGVTGTGTRRAIATLSAYKSLDLPGFAHHVLAGHVAGGYADSRAVTRFSVGGTSGESLELVSGYSVGDDQRTFGVRGFPAGAEQGTRAWTATLEYRAPIAAPSRKLPYLPIFVDRISTAFFYDVGRGYCPTGSSTAPACTGVRLNSPTLASAGAELNFDTGSGFGLPLRIRLGLAVPVKSADLAKGKGHFYVNFGSAF